MNEKRNETAGPLLLMVFLWSLFQGSGAGALEIRYQGFSLDKVIPLEAPEDKEYFHYCLGIIESSSSEARKIYYSKKQFLDLTQKNQAIRTHLSQSLHIDMDHFHQYLLESFGEKDLKETCIEAGDLLKFSVKDSQRTLEEMEGDWKDKYHLLTSSCAGEEKVLKSEDLASGENAYVIRNYRNPLEESRKYWKDPQLEADGIRNLDDIGKYLKLADQFLMNYKMVTNRKKSPEDMNTGSALEKGKEKTRFLDRLSFRHLFKKRGHKIHSLQVDKAGEGHLSLTPEKAAADPFTEDPLLKLIAEEEKKTRKYLSDLQDNQNRFLEKRTNKFRTQDPVERLEQLEEDMKKGPLSPEEIEDYRNLKAQVVFGLDNFEQSRQSKKWGRMVYEPVRNVFWGYNRFATDTIVDVVMDKVLDFSVAQLQPMSKKQDRWFRASKAADGIFVFSTQIAGLAAAPFTFGLSVLAANAVGAGVSSVFSLATSATKKEPVDAALVRAGVKFGHSMGEGQIPVVGNINGIFSSLDDLRVAFKIHERINKAVRGKKGAVKVRWETLGDPIILGLLLERLHYVEAGLLPRGEFFYAYAEMSPALKNLLKSTLLKLHQAQKYLETSLTTSRLRYEYLLKKGKIPNAYVKGIVMGLEEEERERKFYGQKAFQKEEIWKKMLNKAL